MPGMVCDNEVVGVDCVGDFGETLKNISVWNAFKGKRRFVLFVNGLNLNFGGAWQEGASDDARFIAHNVHSQQRVGRLMF